MHRLAKPALIIPLALTLSCAGGPRHHTVAAPAAATRTPESPQTERVERRLVAMGTSLSIAVEARNRPLALAASERAVRAIQAAEARLSTWTPDSELATFNRAPVGTWHAISKELSTDLALAGRCAELTGGAFDPTVGALVELWRLRAGGRDSLPNRSELEVALEATGAGLLELGAPPARARRKAAIRIEEGGFGKGVGLDEAIAAARGDGIQSIWIDLGGQVTWWSEAGETLAVDIADPGRREVSVAALDLPSGSIATTGNSERGITVGGVTYGHVLDPRTGRPAPDFGSLTVWSTEAGLADCLATGLYVLGPTAALDFAATHDGVEVLAIEHTPHGLAARMSAGLVGLVHPGGPLSQISVLEPQPTDHHGLDHHQGTKK